MHIVMVNVSLFSISNNLLKLAQGRRKLYIKKKQKMSVWMQGQEIKSHNTKEWLMKNRS